MPSFKKPTFRFYDKETHQMLYPFDNEYEGYISYLYKEGERIDRKSLDMMIQTPRRFIPNQMIYKDDDVEVYEDDVLHIYGENNDEPFITTVGELGEVELPDGYADFTMTCVKWLKTIGLQFDVIGTIYDDNEEKIRSIIEKSNKE